MKHNKKLLSITLALALTLSVFSPLSSVSAATTDKKAGSTLSPAAEQGFKDYINNEANQFVIVRHKQLGGSHYAYTEGVSDSRGGLDQPNGDEYQFQSGSDMILVTYGKDGGNRTEEVLLESKSGALRDPDVSKDGTKVLFSWKQDQDDDFHLYEMVLATKEYTQLTFGQGISDTECKYLPNGNIVFSSSRAIQTVDCWHTPVSNLYICDKNGKNAVRVGYDQVHTTYPTITDDGRVLYTRWDYNDRNQMYIQSLFQMMPDGTNQTELYGNNSNFPTTILHPTDIPGASGKYFAIASGHHVWQTGKLIKIDTNIDRNDYKDTKTDEHAFSFVDQARNNCKYEYSYDQFGVEGVTYKYPVGISENQLLCSVNMNEGNYTGALKDGGGQGKRDARYGIYYMYINENGATEYKEIASARTSGISAGASQVAPVPKTEKTLFERPSMVSYGTDTGTYYVGNVYEGEAVKNLTKPTYDKDGNVTKAGEVSQLRVVALDFRASAIGRTSANGGYEGGGSDPFSPVAAGNGTWDVKQVLGAVDVEADGSALFKIPSETPVYFQLLNDDGEVLQTMRSWSTLMPNETFSCVGCHENKNSTPPTSASPTLAMQKGVQELKNESWMNTEGNDYEGYNAYKDEPVGFSYMNQVQTILDKSCASCHNNTSTAYGKIAYSPSMIDETIAEERSEWEYSASAFTGSTVYAKDHAPFGHLKTAPEMLNTVVSGDTVYLRKTFNVNQYQKDSYAFYLGAIFTGTAKITLNGNVDQTLTGSKTASTDYQLKSSNIKAGENTMIVELKKSTAGMYFDAKIHAYDESMASHTVIGQGDSGWKYKAAAPSGNWYAKDFDDSSWTTGSGPFSGPDMSNTGTGWGGSTQYSGKDIMIRKTFNVDQEDIDSRDFKLLIKYDESPKVYINGTLAFSASDYKDSGYVTVDLSGKKSLLKAGQNVVAATVTNVTGGKGIDLSLQFTPKATEIKTKTLLAKGASWKYTTSQPSSNWYSEGFSDSSWKTGNALFGNKNSSTSWTTSNIWIRTTFNIDDLEAVRNSTINMNIFFDENPVVYVNGTEIFRADSYNSGYDIKDVTTKIKSLLKAGTNTVAACAANTTGDQYLDVAFTSIPKSSYAVSFSGELLAQNDTKRFWPVSYMLLTGTSYDKAKDLRVSPGGENSYTNILSSMSGAGLVEDKSFGSLLSPLVQMMKSDDHKKYISDADRRTLAAWIDLGVPLCGTYDELNNWGASGTREFEEKENKRDYYEDINQAHRMALAGKTENNGEFTMSYRSGNSILASETGVGTVELNVDTGSNGLKPGDQVVIKLPEGQKYVAFRLDPRFKESIIYCPTGTFSYVVPADISSVFPLVLNSQNGLRFKHLTLSARIPSDNELKNTETNLSVNPYDLKTGNTAYPHVTTSSDCRDQAQFRGRNAIDGFITNQGHDAYPKQSWGPEIEANSWIKIDFGRSVKVNKLVVYTRADFESNHDTNYVSGTIEFSDGTEKKVSFYKTKEGIEFNLDKSVDTSSVKIKDLVTARSDWAGFAEVEVYGTDNLKGGSGDESVPATGITLNKTSATLKSGDKLSLSATIAPANASNKSIVWKSDDYNVANVDLNGNVTATGNGKTTITATTSNGKTAKCEITVSTPVTSISFSTTVINNKSTGDKFTIIAKVNPSTAENQTLKWTSSNPNVVSIDQQGNGVCLSQGVAVITAAATDGSGVVSRGCTVKVTKGNPIPHTLSISPANASVYVGASAQLKAVFTPIMANEAVSWKSSNASVASVSGSGLVKGVKVGTATITATSSSGLTATAKVTVKASVKVSKITVKGKSSLTVGKSTKLSAYVYPTNALNKGVTWKSSNNKIATVSQSGQVKAVSAGKVTIYATAKDSGKVSGKLTIKVKPKAPTKVKAKKASRTSAKVSFKKNKTANYYQIWMKKGNGKYKLIKTTKSASFTKKRLSRKAKYTFRVRGYKKVGKTKYYSDYSKTAKIKL